MATKDNSLPSCPKYPKIRRKTAQARVWEDGDEDEEGEEEEDDDRGGRDAPLRRGAHLRAQAACGGKRWWWRGRGGERSGRSGGTDSGPCPTWMGITATLRGRAGAVVRLGGDSGRGRRGMYENRGAANHTPCGADSGKSPAAGRVGRGQRRAKKMMMTMLPAVKAEAAIAAAAPAASCQAGGGGGKRRRGRGGAARRNARGSRGLPDQTVSACGKPTNGEFFARCNPSSSPPRLRRRARRPPLRRPIAIPHF